MFRKEIWKQQEAHTWRNCVSRVREHPEETKVDKWLKNQRALPCPWILPHLKAEKGSPGTMEVKFFINGGGGTFSKLKQDWFININHKFMLFVACLRLWSRVYFYYIPTAIATLWIYLHLFSCPSLSIIYFPFHKFSPNFGSWRTTHITYFLDLHTKQIFIK